MSVTELCRCPRCKSALEIDPAKDHLKTARRYEDCQRRCLACRIGLSNSRAKPTFIRKDWRAGLWRPEYAERLRTILKHSLNTKSRKTKNSRLANERSEDLLTWNVFSWQNPARRLDPRSDVCPSAMVGLLAPLPDR